MVLHQMCKIIKQVYILQTNKFNLIIYLFIYLIYYFSHQETHLVPLFFNVTPKPATSFCP